MLNITFKYFSILKAAFTQIYILMVNILIYIQTELIYKQLHLYINLYI